MQNKPLLIIGGAGHGSVIADCINDNRTKFGDQEWELKGFVNDFDKEVDGYPVVGTLADIPELLSKGYYFVWAIHLIQHNYLTVRLFENANIPLERLATIVHKSAFVSPSAVLAHGVVVMPNAYIASRTCVGVASLVKANALIGHDAKIGRLCHLAMGSITGTMTSLGECSDVALGARVLEKLTIGACSMAGAGCVLTHDIPDGQIFAGVPARFIKMMQKN